MINCPLPPPCKSLLFTKITSSNFSFPLQSITSLCDEIRVLGMTYLDIWHPLWVKVRKDKSLDIKPQTCPQEGQTFAIHCDKLLYMSRQNRVKPEYNGICNALYTYIVFKIG